MRWWRITATVLLAGWTAAVSTADDVGTSGQAIAGYVEDVQVFPEGVVLEGRLDTGAKTSSINAPDHETFEKDDEEWVRFTVMNGDEEVEYERPVERTVIIRSANGGTQRRPVVLLGLCIRDVFREVEVNLSDREDMTHPLLVGRNFLEGSILVDAAVDKLHEPACEIPDEYQ